MERREPEMGGKRVCGVGQYQGPEVACVWESAQAVSGVEGQGSGRQWCLPPRRGAGLYPEWWEPWDGLTWRSGVARFIDRFID